MNERLIIAILVTVLIATWIFTSKQTFEEKLIKNPEVYCEDYSAYQQKNVPAVCIKYFIR